MSLRDIVSKDTSGIQNIFGWDDAIMLGLGAAGAISSASDAKKAQKAQQAQNDATNTLSRESLDLARQAQQQSLATTIDQNGNISAYDTATNTWRVILSPEQQRIMNATNSELYKALTSDAALARGQQVSNATRQQGEGQTADALKRQIDTQISGGGVSADSLASTLRRARQGAVTSAYDDTGSALNRQALRSGSAATGTFGSALAKQRAQTLAQTLGVPELEGMQLADATNQDRLGSNISAYNTFATRAAGNPVNANTSVNPGGSLADALAGTKSGALAATGALSGATTNAANLTSRLPVVQPTGNTTSLISGLGSLFGSSGLGDYLGAMTKNRGTTSAGFNLNGGS